MPFAMNLVLEYLGKSRNEDGILFSFLIFNYLICMYKFRLIQLMATNRKYFLNFCCCFPLRDGSMPKNQSIVKRSFNPFIM